jgi:O-antigen ligase
VEFMQRVRKIPDINSLALIASLASLSVLLVYVAQQFGSLRTSAVFVLFPCLVLIVPLILARLGKLIGIMRSRVAWWHVPWLFLFLSDLTFRIRDQVSINQDPVDVWAAYRIALVGLTGMILVFRLGIAGGGWFRSISGGLVGLLTLYTLVCAASTAWSGYPAWTFYKSAEFLVDVVLLAAILKSAKTEEDWRTLFNWNLALHALLVVSAWVGAVVWPRDAFQRANGLFSAQLNGVLPAISSNGLGEMGAVLAVVALSRLISRTAKKSSRLGYALLFAGGSITIVLSQTRSAVLGFLLGSVLVLFFGRRMRLLGILLLASTLLLTLTSAGTITGEFLRRGQSDDAIRGLSGRVGYWELGWQQFLKHPFTGLGAYTARFEVLVKLGEGDTSSSHNTYMEVLVGVGPAGLVLLLAALLGTWWGLVRFLRRTRSIPIRHPLAVDCIGILGIITVRSFFSVEMIWHPALLFFIVLGYVELLRRQKLTSRSLAL